MRLATRHALNHRSASFQRLWADLHSKNAHRGQYSLERLSALHEFRLITSYARVTALLVLAALIPLVAIVTLDTLPLQDPSDGWRRNEVLWVRMFLSMFIISTGVALQFQTMAPMAGLTLLKCVLVGLYGAVGFTGSLLPIANYVGFPIPFQIVMGLPAWSCTFYPGLALAVGIRKIQRDRGLRDQTRLFVIKVTIECSFMVIYPIYSLAFRSLPDNLQFAFIIVLQGIKYALKKLMARVVRDYEDLVPVLVVSVDLFHAIYQSKCMQTAGSVYTTLGIIVIDVIQNIHAIRKLSQHMTEVQSISREGQLESKGLLDFILKLADEPGRLAKSEKLLDDDHALLIKRTLELLWKCELILLVEYIETAIPLLYSVYLIVLYHLPNAKYYTGMTELTPAKLQSSITGIVLYALMEALSLICVHVVLMRKFHVSALHQLAFVFRNDWLVVQGSFMAWVILILQFTLAHNGVDFSFHFDWIK